MTLLIRKKRIDTLLNVVEQVYFIPSRIQINNQDLEMNLRTIKKLQMNESIFPIGLGYQFELQGILEEQVTTKLKIREYLVVALGL